MNEKSDKDSLKELEKEVLEAIQICRKCRICIAMCPTFEGWFTQSSMGRLTAINCHFKYGLGNEEELIKLLFACTTCRRCEERCKMVSMGVSPTDIILKTRQLLVKRQKALKDEPQ
jgi:Fe-S oxidoreductase